MKNLVLVGLSVVTLLISCKCKKATSDSAASEQATAVEVKDGVNNQEKVITADTTPKTAVEENIDKNQESDGVVYEASSRGYFLKVKFADGKLAYTKGRDSEKMEEVVLTKAQSDELNSLLNAFKPEVLPGLKAPTEKRFYDGAAMANLSITQKGSAFTSETFDHGFPPATIEKFVKKLLSYTK